MWNNFSPNHDLKNKYSGCYFSATKSSNNVKSFLANRNFSGYEFAHICSAQDHQILDCSAILSDGCNLKRNWLIGFQIWNIRYGTLQPQVCHLSTQVMYLNIMLYTFFMINSYCLWLINNFLLVCNAFMFNTCKCITIMTNLSNKTQQTSTDFNDPLLVFPQDNVDRIQCQEFMHMSNAGE